MPGRWPDGFVGGPDDRRALLVLTALQGLTPRKLFELARREGTASACLAAVRAGRAGSEGDRRFAAALDASALEAALTTCGARLITPERPEYPSALEDLEDPPVAVFVRGRSLEELAPRVAIVGARACTDLGVEVAEELGGALASAGACTLSGGARGIDSAAHEGALRAGGATIAVLGCGIDRSFPPASRSLLARVERAGALVGEYPPGVPAAAFRFPARNRLIAALSKAVVVVEGAGGSGSLITAEHALDLGRSVLAVPGAVTNPKAAAPLALIRDGAACIRGGADLLADLGLDGLGASIGALGPVIPILDPDERAILAALPHAMLAEDVARAARRPEPIVLGILARLELRGLVRNVGGRFEPRRSVQLPLSSGV